MATPDENIQTLKTYWANASPEAGGWTTEDLASGNGTLAIMGDTGSLAYKAAVAAGELVGLATTNTYVRQQIAAQGIFEQIVGSSFANAWQSVLAQLAGATFGRKIDPPAFIFINGVRLAATGGYFKAQDPTGLASWIASPLSAGVIVTGALAGETDYRTLEVMIDLLYQAAVPTEWAAMLIDHNGGLATLDARIGTTRWTNGTAADESGVQKMLRDGAEKIRGKMGQVIGQLRAAKVMENQVVPSVPLKGYGVGTTGDGTVTATTPGSKPFYQNLSFWGSAALGLIGGGWAVGRIHHDVK